MNETQIITWSFVIGFITVFFSSMVFNHINPWFGFGTFFLGVYVFYLVIIKQINKNENNKF